MKYNDALSPAGKAVAACHQYGAPRRADHHRGTRQAE
jgi:hypothetical protein